MNFEENADHRWANRLLAQAVGAEPELGFRAEDVLAKGRRELARRRAALTGGLTVAALVATTVGLSHFGSPQRGVQAGQSGAAATSPAAPSAPTATTIYGGQGPLVVDAHARALTAGLESAHVIPSGVSISTDKYYGGEPLVFYKLITGQYVNSYFAQATLTDSHGAGHLVVHVLKQPTGLNCVAPTQMQQCHMQDLPDGSHITVMRYTPTPIDKPIIQWNVELVRPDGTAVDVLCGNWSMAGDGGGIAQATGAEPPLDEETVVRLAQLPGLAP